MALTTDEVRKIATLARLRFTPEEEATLTGQLGRIVDYIDQLQRIEAVAEAPAAGPAHEAEDRTAPCLAREDFLENAPAAIDSFLVVPEVKGGGGDDRHS
jgi:aspartyl-tRNA(Asn)/glutamyl-tRNA(Gln) amidotransferase subunit C